MPKFIAVIVMVIVVMFMTRNSTPLRKHPVQSAALPVEHSQRVHFSDIVRSRTLDSIDEQMERKYN